MTSGTLSDLDLAFKLYESCGEDSENRLKIIYAILNDTHLDEPSRMNQIAEVWSLIGIKNTSATTKHTLRVAMIALRLAIIAKFDFKSREMVRARNVNSGAVGTYMWTMTQNGECLIEVINPFGQPTFLDPIRYTFTRVE